MKTRQTLGTVLLVLVWAAGSSLAGAVIGLAVGFFKNGAIEAPTVAISLLFGNVVGLTALLSSVFLYRWLHGLAPTMRVLLLGLMLISGSVAGTLAVLNSYPLFVFSDPRQAVAIVAINGVLAVIVGSLAFAYEGMRARLRASLREIEQVRLVEARLREEAARAELAALQARINPHFFFNTLNTIASLLGEDPETAEEVVQTLGDLFRYAFRVSDAGPVTLAEELHFTRDYLTVEQARFGPRLRVEWTLDPRADSVLVPGLIVQPLVENAVGHGIAPRASGGSLRIVTGLAAGRLTVDVIDNGVGLPRAADNLIREGHGLGNVQRRLAAFYAGDAELSLSADPRGTGTRARLTLPADADRAVTPAATSNSRGREIPS